MQMMTARLYTPQGHVADVEVPPFETGYPPVLQWGARTFLLVRQSPKEGEYLETFCYVATVEVQQLTERDVAARLAREDARDEHDEPEDRCERFWERES